MKELIYHDVTKVLYMMKNHGIRFQHATLNYSFIDVRISDVVKIANEYLSLSSLYHDTPVFKVHPDDVHRYNDSIDDTLILNEHGESVAWLAPSEIREVKND